MRSSTAVLMVLKTRNLCTSAKGEAFPETLNNFNKRKPLEENKALHTGKGSRGDCTSLSALLLWGEIRIQNTV